MAENKDKKQGKAGGTAGKKGGIGTARKGGIGIAGSDRRRKIIAGKQRHLFKGRFGKRHIRRKANKKWQRWRRNRGIDLHRRKEDGLIVKIGYRTWKKVRFMHPSGYLEAVASNVNDVRALKGKEVVVRVAGAVGKKKKDEIIKEADKMKLRVLNR